MYLVFVFLVVAQVFSSTVAASSIGVPNDAGYHSKRDITKREKSCTSVLTIEQCKSLLGLVKSVDLPVPSIADAITDVVTIQGVEKNNEIYSKVVKYLDARMLCDMILSFKSCKRLIAASLKYKMPYHEVDGYLQMLSLQESVDKKVVFNKLMKFIKYKKMTADMIVDMKSSNDDDNRVSFDESMVGRRR